MNKSLMNLCIAAAFYQSPADADVGSPVAATAATVVPAALAATADATVKEPAETALNPKDPTALSVNEEFTYSFKKDELGNKRDTIKLFIPCPTLAGVKKMLEDAKQTEYVLDVLAGEVYKQSRTQVGDETKPVNTQDGLDVSKLTMEFIANMPKAERRGGGIAKEIWAAFAADYIAVMPAVTGKNAEQVGNAAKLLVGKFQAIKTNKPVLKFMKEQLGLWFVKTPNPEEFADCYQFLDEKAETLLKADEAALLANL